MAELRTNGLIFVQTGTVAMKKEDLFISADEVRVDYVFENTGDKDEKTLVAFPMPDIDGNPFVPTAIPDDTSENFLDFTVAVDGKIVEPKVDMRASVVGIDVTDELKSHGIPLFPFGDAAYAATDALPDDVKLDMARRGILVLDEFDQGQGMEKHYRPYWTLRTTYWWEMTFPAGKEVIVQHRYKPSVGGTAGVTFVEDGKLAGETYETYKQRYCFDAGFEKAFLKTVTADNPYGPFMESRIAYVLTTGRTGPPDRRLPPHGRQGQPEEPDILLRHGRREDRADHLRDVGQGLLSAEGPRHPDPDAPGGGAVRGAARAAPLRKAGQNKR